MIKESIKITFPSISYNKKILIDPITNRIAKESVK